VQLLHLLEVWLSPLCGTQIAVQSHMKHKRKHEGSGLNRLSENSNSPEKDFTNGNMRGQVSTYDMGWHLDVGKHEGSGLNGLLPKVIFTKKSLVFFTVSILLPGCHTLTSS